MAASDIQGFKDSHARLVAAEKKPDRPDFHWWKGHEWRDIFVCLASHGLDRCRVELWDGLKADGTAEAWIVVKDAASGKTLGAFDVSHPCPPFCPDEAVAVR